MGIYKEKNKKQSTCMQTSFDFWVWEDREEKELTPCVRMLEELADLEAGCKGLET